jgi:hypothetical protein
MLRECMSLTIACLRSINEIKFMRNCVASLTRVRFSSCSYMERNCIITINKKARLRAMNNYEMLLLLPRCILFFILWACGTRYEVILRCEIF